MGEKVERDEAGRGRRGGIGRGGPDARTKQERRQRQRGERPWPGESDWDRQHRPRVPEVAAQGDRPAGRLDRPRPGLQFPPAQPSWSAADNYHIIQFSILHRVYFTPLLTLPNLFFRGLLR